MDRWVSNTELSWKGLSLGIQLEARYGNKVLNQDRSLFESDGYYGDQNIWKGALNYWKQPGDMNVLPETGIQQLEQQYANLYPLSRGW